MTIARTSRFAALAVAGLFAAAVPSLSMAGDQAGMKCEASSACKGHGACKGASNACKGENACKGQGHTMQKDAKACAAAQQVAMAEKKQK